LGGWSHFLGGGRKGDILNVPFSSPKDCERAVALYAAGRGAKAEQAISHTAASDQARDDAVFERWFPEPKNMDATARALIDPEFQRWVQSKLVPMVAGSEGTKSS
jgi:hypothetical protein